MTTEIKIKDLSDNYSVFCELTQELEKCVADVVANGKTDTEPLGSKLRLIRYSVKQMINSIDGYLELISSVPGESTRDEYKKYAQECEVTK